jgi:hypothetical protein
MSLLISPVSPTSSIIPTILATDSPNVPYTSYPYLTSVNLSYTTPNIGTYENMNADPKVQMRIVKYFYYKVLDKWLYTDMLDVLNYLKTKNNKIDLLDNLNEYNENSVDKDSDDTVKQKIDFIEKYIFTKTLLFKILNKFVKETGNGWISLPKMESLIKDLIEDKLTKRMRQVISEKKA